MILQFTLARKADVDLISFFLQQDRKMAVLVTAALCSYIDGTPLNFMLNPVTITEQEKNLNVYIALKERTNTLRKGAIERNALIHKLEAFLNEIPNGMRAVYIKGILRHTYGSLLYQTIPNATLQVAPSYHSYTTPYVSPAPVIQPTPIKEVPSYPEKETTSSCYREPEVSSGWEDGDTDDPFSLFESLLS